MKPDWLDVNLRPSSHGELVAIDAVPGVREELHKLVATGGAPGMKTISEWLQLVRSEYLEVPGLSLNRQQFQRLWSLDRVTSDTLVEALIAARFLARTTKGTYVRHD